MVKFRSAASAFRTLNGVVCVYKPPCVPVRQVQHTIITNLCRDLNALPDRLQEQRVVIEGPTTQEMSVKILPNYADDPLVCGPRYIQEDFRCSWATHLGLFSSGVLCESYNIISYTNIKSVQVLGINDGTKLTYRINTSRLTRAYRIHGELGKATDTYFWNGKTVERSTYDNVTREKIDAVVAHMQAAHQKTMYQMSGVHMESQTMYELASQGLIRPANNKLPVIYGLKCVYFKPPIFELEVQAVNEYDKYLWTIVHDLGVQLKSTAHCTAVRCIRQGKFDVDLALLRKYWQLEHIVNNINQCRQIMEDDEGLLSPESAILSL